MAILAFSLMHIEELGPEVAPFRPCAYGDRQRVRHHLRMGYNCTECCANNYADRKIDNISPHRECLNSSIMHVTLVWKA